MIRSGETVTRTLIMQVWAVGIETGDTPLTLTCVLPFWTTQLLAGPYSESTVVRFDWGLLILTVTATLT